MIARALSMGCLALALLAMPTLAQEDEAATLEAKVETLEKKVDSLENQLRRLNAQMRQLQTQVRKAAQGEDDKPGPEAERKAAALLREIRQLASKGNARVAKEKLQELASEYGGTRAARSARSVRQELELIGSDAPQEYYVKRWLQGEAQLPPQTPTLLVFWEIWCPHCRREAPKMQEMYDKLKSQGLQIVGMTRLSRGATEEKVLEFLSQQKINYPVAVVDYAVNQAFNVRGIPAAAAVKDGKIVWRGHPARLSEETVKGWL